LVHRNAGSEPLHADAGILLRHLHRDRPTGAEYCHMPHELFALLLPRMHNKLRKKRTNIPLQKNRKNAEMTPFAASFLLSKTEKIIKKSGGI